VGAFSIVVQGLLSFAGLICTSFLFFHGCVRLRLVSSERTTHLGGGDALPGKHSLGRSSLPSTLRTWQMLHVHHFKLHHLSPAILSLNFFVTLLIYFLHPLMEDIIE
jgi:hypothetical protein